MIVARRGYIRFNPQSRWIAIVRFESQRLTSASRLGQGVWRIDHSANGIGRGIIPIRVTIASDRSTVIVR